LFFIFAKIFWFFLRPLNLLFFAAIASAVFGWAGYRKFAIRSLVSLAAIFAIIAFTQLPDWLLYQLESRAVQAELTERPYGIIVLGGGLTANTALNPTGYNLGESGDRIIRGIELKRRFPDARLVYSGGLGAIRQTSLPETAAAQAVITALAGAELQIELESQSRNTWQNAIYTSEMIGGARSRQWLLVTSAFHMPRAIGCFRKAGFNVMPAPADFRADPVQFPYLADKSAQQFLKFNIFIKEILGLAAYRLTGRIDSFLPLSE
jgi:uncharacterized SAM-binding protein YcdF (DUF218 family)